MSSAGTPAGVFLCKALRGSTGDGGVGTGCAVWVGRLVARLAPAWLFDWLASAYVRHMLGSKQVFKHSLKPRWRKVAWRACARLQRSVASSLHVTTNTQSTLQLL